MSQKRALYDGEVCITEQNKTNSLCRLQQNKTLITMET